ncbi:Imm50 family immunity protein [Deinococcus radiomollis]|uniref:Imm50 family immunity protein n=1 Tax=Deinococcus radiomollis TaxID=468916 RepID=UPI003892255C
MSWTDFIVNKRHITGIYSDHLKLSDLELYRIEIDHDRAAVYIFLRTDVLPIKRPNSNKWASEFNSVAFTLHAQIIDSILYRGTPYISETRIGIKRSLGFIVVELSSEKASFTVACSNLSVMDLHPF